MAKYKVFFYDGEDVGSGYLYPLEEAVKEDFVEIIGDSLEPTDQCSVLIEYEKSGWTRADSLEYIRTLVKHEKNKTGEVVKRIKLW